MSYRRGHVRGPKRERAHSQDWYAQIEAATIARLEQEEAAQRALDVLEDETLAWQERHALQEPPHAMSKSTL